MAVNCPDPNFPIEEFVNVLADSSFSLGASDGSPHWEMSGGWSQGNFIVNGVSVTNGIHFRQKSGQFLASYGAGENDIINGESFRLSVSISRDEDNNGKIRGTWGSITTSFFPGSFVVSIDAPASGDFRLDVQSGANTFTGSVNSISLRKLNCRKDTDVGGGGGFGGGGSGNIGGAILLAGETPKSGFSNNFHAEEQDGYGSDMRIFSNEINDDFDRNLIGGQ